MAISDNIAAIRDQIIAEGHGSPLGQRLKRKALDAISGGTSQWVSYMTEFAKSPQELARLIPTDGTENDPAMNDARAYLVAKAPCATDTVTTFLKTITTALDI